MYHRLFVRAGAAALACAALVLAGCGGGGGGGGDVTEHEILIDLQAVGASGTTGSVSITKRGDGTIIVVDAIVPSGGGEQPAHVHTGTCAGYDETPKYEIGNLQEGTGAVTLDDVPVSALLDSPHAVVVYKSPEEPDVVIACADIKAE